MPLRGGAVAEGDGFEEFSSDIGTIETGITPTGTIEITKNDVYDVTEYASADVDIPQDFTVSENYTVSGGNLITAYFDIIGDVVAHIPNNVTTIKANAFGNNQTINVVIMDDSVTTIDNGNLYPPDFGVFYQCANLKNVILSKSITAIPNAIFFSCFKLNNIIIPYGVTSIGNDAFNNCTGLTNITIPNSVVSIGKRAFTHCTSLTSVILSSAISNIDESAFSGGALTDIYYTGTQTEWNQITIGTNAIPEGVTIHYEYTPT